jgi:hypothetical protein
VSAEAVLTAEEIRELGQYNAEKARGIMHISDWERRMAELQEKFAVTVASIGDAIYLSEGRWAKQKAGK